MREDERGPDVDVTFDELARMTNSPFLLWSVGRTQSDYSQGNVEADSRLYRRKQPLT